MHVRDIVLGAMRCTGVFKLWQRAHRNSVSMLVFHGVCPPRATGDARAPIRARLSTADFERYVKLLSGWFTLVTVDDVADMLSGRTKMRPNCLALTFDDGYLNNATRAWPILKRHGATATFFVSTGYVETGRFLWADRLDHALRHLRPDVTHVPVGGSLILADRRDRRHLPGLYDRVKAACDALGWAEAARQTEAIESLATSRLGDSPDDLEWAGFMDWRQMRAMRDEGACFGSHTVTHAMLDELAAPRVREELALSKADIERNIGHPCLSVAYPRGRCTRRIALAAAEVGYRTGLLTVERAATYDDWEMQHPRVGLPSRPLSADDLRARATLLSAALAGLGDLGRSTRRRPACVPATGASLPPIRQRA
jgi:peptidoglycan/xylan/chitin deacetylase (PgdA/CDA1 family)